MIKKIQFSRNIKSTKDRVKQKISDKKQDNTLVLYSKQAEYDVVKKAAS